MAPKHAIFKLSGLPALAVAAGLACMLCSSAVLPAVQGLQQDSFTDRAASQLLNQIADALVAHNQKKMLGAFDTAKMTDGPLFRQQINSFFAQTGTIRVHFNLVQATMENEKGLATVDVEMEADRRDDSLPPVHKQAQLRLVAEESAAVWKFTEVQPRTFFSIQP